MAGVLVPQAKGILPQGSRLGRVTNPTEACEIRGGILNSGEEYEAQVLSSSVVAVDGDVVLGKFG